MILEEIFKAVNYKVKQAKNKHMKSSNISFMSVSKSLKPMELQFKGYGKAVMGCGGHQNFSVENSLPY